MGKAATIRTKPKKPAAVAHAPATDVVAEEPAEKIAALVPVDLLAHPIKDVPRVLGVSKATLYRMINAGDVRPRNLFGCVVVPRTDLQALVDGAPLSRKAAQ